MKTIIIIGIIFCVYKIISKLSAESKERQHEAERQRIRDEQAAIRAEQERQKAQIRAEIERAKLETHERIEAEKRRIEWQKRQDAINARLEKEQERQAKEIERHEAELRKARFEIEQNKADVDFLQERTSELYAQIDYYTLLQAGTIPGSKEHSKYQSKIVTLHNQIHTAENKLRRAEWCKAEAERKVEV